MVLAPFARRPLGEISAFIPAYESALAITDLITAVLLFGQFLRSRSMSILVLACGYLFATLMIVPHALTFPGVFGVHGILGGDSQSTAWLYCFWHGGFSLSFVVYALARRGDERGFKTSRLLRALFLAILATCAFAAGLTLVALNGQNLLTTIINGTDYSMLVTKGISPGICALSLLAAFLLFPLRKFSTLDLWLLVVMCAWLCDVILSAVIGSSRFDLGWYAGRSFGLLAASFLLATLLIELNTVYDRLLKTELHRSNTLFESVINMTPDLVFVKDLQSRAILRNPAAMFGKTWSDIEGRKEEEWHQNSAEAAQVVLNDRKVIETQNAMQFVEQFTTDRGQRTLLSTKSPLFDAGGKVVGVIGVSTDITDRESRAKHLEFIMKELSHRSKNLLMIIQAIARQSIRQSQDLQDFEHQFNERLASLARLHDLLVQEEWRGAALRAVVQTQTGPFAGDRIKIEGPDIRLRPDVAQVISMVLHELATNASKYGALSSAAGIVSIDWNFVGSERKRLFVRWTEQGGPMVMSPQRKGFGTIVLERMALQIADASSVIKFHQSGIIWYLEAPFASFVDASENTPA